LAEAIAEVLTDDARRADLIARGTTRAGQLRWEHTAESMHALYAEAAQDR
jgi:hypothetical protein